ncbi:hypothetical protein AX17_000456 [Amanita inopinata Kibby_2008]|nr:hypothetical protein AX17_000456 [Amanita inopinata Kibby_2008]
MSNPPWMTLMQGALAQYNKQTVFQLATIDQNASVPQVRSHIFRSFLVPPTAPLLPLIVTTTDIRTLKISQIMSNPRVHAVHWIEGTQKQFRIAGRAFVVPAPANSLYDHFMHDILKSADADKPESKGGVAVLARSKFDWEKQRLETFKSLGGHMQATWCRPLPGSPLSSKEEANKWPEKIQEPKSEDGEELKRNWETALGNFSLLIIDPDECDLLELGVIPNRRTRFTRTDDANWSEQALVP